jgi:hypothetical protein
MALKFTTTKMRKSMVFKHVARGSGEVTYTNSEIFDYSTGNGGAKPPHTNKFPTDRITHLHKTPVEPPRHYDGTTSPKDPEGPGPHFVFKGGPSSAPGRTTNKNPYAPLNNPRGIPYRDKFNRGFNSVGSGEMEARGSGGPAAKDRGVRYVDSKGRVTYRGRSG